ncbi:hypothetical protein [Kitasatospora sp. DSM 101779]|uniref:hypothetical protein n=1 Tax=Kitasatospora sp. DSM 101779 TaxID=2853165 RepID=UPI0021D96DE2|nr:hypothetical protein [Kitasatospora sp. DSM 101779]MCU7826577.1 hypothetical protein [Kitasatospora sp. DSM 101779]
MDSALAGIVDALKAVEKQTRDVALAKSRSHHDPVPLVDQPHLLGALAAAVEALRDVAGTFPDRMHTPDGRASLRTSAERLAAAAAGLRNAERHAAAGGV